MDTIISYDEVAALVANPPAIAPHPNFMNLHNLRHHIQRALMRVSCPQSSILGWASLIMSRTMYGLLTTSLFHIPMDPGPLAIYYPPRVSIVDTKEAQSSMGRECQHTKPSQPLVEQNRLPSTLASSVQKILGSCIKIYDVQYSTASTMGSTMHSRYQTIPPLPDGIR